ncbi:MULTISPECIES: alpha/beta hydrolase family protein [Niastella]|uniref:S9 family peptidase n=1 Tax=Niastella soli TaxID=2821487 RepID=A0ABS3YU54_9BACT|nr:prolyl oligopeptidase family serine peptidase [Niastella soli]MBO9201405.1 S9 family peptidase [Niastella soli]
MQYLGLILILLLSNIGATAQRLVLQDSNLIPYSVQDFTHYLWTPMYEKTGKPVIDFSAIDHWYGVEPSLHGVAISPDGRYFTYKIQNQPFNSYTIVIQAIDSTWKYTFCGAEPGCFSGDSRHYILRVGDSLCFLTLGKMQLRYIPGVSGYKLFEQGKGQWLVWQYKDSVQRLVLYDLFSDKEKMVFRGVSDYSFDNSGQWLCCQLTGAEKELLLYNLITGVTLRFSSVVKYVLDDKGKLMILETDQNNRFKLQWVPLLTGKTRMIWEADSEGNNRVDMFVLDKTGSQLAFLVQQLSDSKYNENSVKVDDNVANTIWYYKEGMIRATLKVKDQSPGISSNLYIHGAPNFTSDGKYIMFSLKPQVKKRESNPNAVQVDVWNYKDPMLQSEQLLLDPNNISTYTAVIGTENGTSIQLSTTNRKYLGVIGDYALVKHDVCGDRFWEKPEIDSFWLVSMKSGSSFFLVKQLFANLAVSPTHKYLFYFDEAVGHYFSYDIVTGKKKNISETIPVYMGTEQPSDPLPGFSNLRTGIAGWLEGEKGVLLYDSYDIWQLDLTGKMPPVNVTNGYGRKHGITFRLTGGLNKSASYINGIGPIFSTNGSLVLTAYNTTNGDNGFYQKTLNMEGDPTLLSMGPWLMSIEANSVLNNGDNAAGMITPMKAQNADVWIVRRQAATDALNYFFTTNFKQFKRLTNIQPQSAYNWMTSELIAFPQMDKTISQGVLYKPENFNPAQKYPVLINYYFQFSQLLNECPSPYYMGNGFLNIPWFVSRGYLVFTPDIYFTQGRPRPASALNTVEGAALFLSKLPYVNSKRIGICGHSRAGGYTNYILTHSNLFTAALSSAGVSDWISAQLYLIKDIGVPRLSAAQQEPFFWEKFEVMKESPIMNVDKITSPLLIMHNKLDGAVPWEQAVELFVAMRRFGKSVWMLQYDNENHNMANPQNCKDFTIRVTQYFDHFLKEAPEPKWMVTGVPANLKGIEHGLELEINGGFR